MNKKKMLIPFILVIVICIAVLITVFSFGSDKANTNEAVIPEIDLKAVDNLMIGSEPPKLLYADKEKVIFNCGGVYVYDIKNELLAKSFDTSPLLSEKYTKYGCFVTKDGKQIIFSVTKESEGVIARYGYSFENNLVKEVTEKENAVYRENMFQCTSLDYNDELYQKSSGILANISNHEYIYLTFQDWKVSTIRIVHVKDGKETYYNVFDDV